MRFHRRGRATGSVRRLIVSAALAIGAAVGVAAAAAPSAQGLGLVVCPTGTEVAHYTPGLRNFTQFVSLTYTDTFTGCTGTDFAISYGTIRGFADLDMSCVLSDPNSPFDQYSATVEWNSGRTSEILITLQVLQSPGGVLTWVSTGRVTSGAFNGGLVTWTVAAPSINIADCLQPPGITTTNGPAQITITQL